MARKATNPAQKEMEIKPPVAPTDRAHRATKDARERFAKLTAAQPKDKAFRAAFEQSKMLMAHTHPVESLSLRNDAVRSVEERLGSKAALKLTQPVPGGVGYGFFYTTAYKVGWGHGTSMAFDVVCPTPPGGNVNTFLYLTATNRSAMGVEAFVSYNGQNDTHFRVFDWARSDHWQTDCPFSALGNYLTTKSAHGHPYQVLPVWNSTWRIGTDRWRNQALLYNRVRRGWDLIYQYDYTATDAQQKTGWIGSWGPIVETFSLSIAEPIPWERFALSSSVQARAAVGGAGGFSTPRIPPCALTTWASLEYSSTPTTRSPSGARDGAEKESSDAKSWPPYSRSRRCARRASV